MTKETIKKLTKAAGLKQEDFDGKFIFDEDQLFKNVPFPLGKVNDRYYFGLLLPKEVPIRIKNKETKKEEIIGKKQIKEPVVIFDNGEMIELTVKNIERLKVQFEPVPEELPLRYSLKMIKDFLDGKTRSIDKEDLFNRIRQDYEKTIWFHKKGWYDILSLWDLGTYFYPLFSTYPLLELTSSVAGTAKSKTMDVSYQHTFSATEKMVNPSGSSIFRLTNEQRPTKYLDEAEKLWTWVNGQWISSDLVELLNGSYKKGSLVPRSEQFGRSFKTVYFQTYSPSMVASINGIKGATLDRSISCVLNKSPDSDERGDVDILEFVERNEKELQQLRDDLFLFAMEHWKGIEETYRNLEHFGKIKRRDRERWKPLLAIAKYINEDLFNQILDFAATEATQKKEDSLQEGTFKFEILNICYKHFFEDPMNRDKIHISSIKAALPSPQYDRVHEKTISTELSKFGFRDYRSKDNQGSYFEIPKDVFRTLIEPLYNFWGDNNDK